MEREKERESKRVRKRERKLKNIEKREVETGEENRTSLARVAEEEMLKRVSVVTNHFIKQYTYKTQVDSRESKAFVGIRNRIITGTRHPLIPSSIPTSLFSLFPSLPLFFSLAPSFPLTFSFSLSVILRGRFAIFLRAFALRWPYINALSCSKDKRRTR